MIVRTLSEIVDGERDVRAPTFASRRLLLAEDGTGFSLHDTVLYAGTTTEIWYKHHLEAVYCIEGHATVHDLDNDDVYDIRPGTLYTLDGHERHTLTVHEDVRMICVFTPALTGNEVHDEEGTYPLLAPNAPEAVPAKEGANP